MPPAPHLRQTRAPFINLLSHLDFITPRCAYIVRSIAAAGLALAWLGDPLVDRLQRRGYSRNLAVTLVFTAMSLVVVVALVASRMPRAFTQ